MLHERIYLDPSDERVYIDSYVADDRTVVKDAMLVIPGGGYHGVCFAREGEPIALAYMARGYNCFVLSYRVSDYATRPDCDGYPSQLIDASRAMVYIRNHACELNINPDRVFAVGFSAGGHLAGSLAILADDEAVLSTVGCPRGMNRPTASVLAYPVVTAMAATHEGSFAHLMRMPYADIPESDRRRLSLEEHVDARSAPLFIWHTAEDIVVPPVGSLMLAAKYTALHLPVSLRLYPYGGHGTALANEVTACGGTASIQPLAEGWFEESVAWLKTIE